jgi:hypothetical protein
VKEQWGINTVTGCGTIDKKNITEQHGTKD